MLARFLLLMVLLSLVCGIAALCAGVTGIFFAIAVFGIVVSCINIVIWSLLAREGII